MGQLSRKKWERRRGAIRQGEIILDAISQLAGVPKGQCNTLFAALTKDRPYSNEELTPRFYQGVRKKFRKHFNGMRAFIADIPFSERRDRSPQGPESSGWGLRPRVV